MPGRSGQTCGAPFSSAASAPIDMRQRLPFDLDRLGGVARLIQRIGHDEGDRVADMADLVRASTG